MIRTFQVPQFCETRMLDLRSNAWKEKALKAAVIITRQREALKASGKGTGTSQGIPCLLVIFGLTVVGTQQTDVPAKESSKNQ